MKTISIIFILFTTGLSLWGHSEVQRAAGSGEYEAVLAAGEELPWFSRTERDGTELEMGLPVASELTEPVEPWILWMLLVQLLIIGVVRYLFPPLIPELMRTITNYNIALQRFRHSDKEPAAVDMVLRLSAWLTFSFMISLGLQFYFDFHFGWQLIVMVGLFLLAFYIFRKLTKQVVGSIFRFGDELRFANYYSDYLVKGLGLASYPLLMLFLFGSIHVQYGALYLFIFILMIFIIARFLRGLKAGKSLILGNAFHFILYICTLEIIPILLICKLFIMYYGSI